MKKLLLAMTLALPFTVAACGDRSQPGEATPGTMGSGRGEGELEQPAAPSTGAPGSTAPMGSPGSTGSPSAPSTGTTEPSAPSTGTTEPGAAGTGTMGTEAPEPGAGADSGAVQLEPVEEADEPTP